MISRLRPADTLVAVVDVQERLVPLIHDSESVIANIRLLSRAARALDLPVVLTTQYAKGLGRTQAEVAELAPTATPFDKTTFSAMGSPAFQQTLNASGRRTLLLCGIEAHICVLQTGLDALAAGYQVHLVVDATSSRSPRNADLGRRRLEVSGAVLSSTEMAIYELLGSSDAAAFKALLPYLK